MKSLVALALAAAFVPAIRQESPRPGEATLALDGLDPVALCEGHDTDGSEEFTATRGRFSYRFASEASLARFRAEPARYEIQWGGGCGRMGPLSGTGDPARYVVHDGHIYVFASDGCRSGFLSAPERFAVEAAAPVMASSRTKAAAEAGRAWIARALATHGGAMRGALHFERNGLQDGWTHRHDLVVRMDGGLYERDRWVGPPDSKRGHDSLWVLAEDAFLVENGALLDVHSEDQRNDLERTAQRHPLVLLAASARLDFLAFEIGRSTHDGRELVDIAVTVEGLETVLHLDPASARVCGLSWRGRLADGITREVVELFDSYVDVAGLLVPDRRRVTLDGKASAANSSGWDHVALLSEAPASLFERSSSLDISALDSRER